MNHLNQLSCLDLRKILKSIEEDIKSVLNSHRKIKIQKFENLLVQQKHVADEIRKRKKLIKNDKLNGRFLYV